MNYSYAYSCRHLRTPTRRFFFSGIVVCVSSWVSRGQLTGRGSGRGSNRSSKSRRSWLTAACKTASWPRLTFVSSCFSDCKVMSSLPCSALNEFAHPMCKGWGCAPADRHSRTYWASLKGPLHPMQFPIRSSCQRMPHTPRVLSSWRTSALGRGPKSAKLQGGCPSTSGMTKARIMVSKLPRTAGLIASPGKATTIPTIPPEKCTHAGKNKPQAKSDVCPLDRTLHDFAVVHSGTVVPCNMPRERTW